MKNSSASSSTSPGIILPAPSSSTKSIPERRLLPPIRPRPLPPLPAQNAILIPVDEHAILHGGGARSARTCAGALTSPNRVQRRVDEPRLRQNLVVDRRIKRMEIIFGSVHFDLLKLELLETVSLGDTVITGRVPLFVSKVLRRLDLLGNHLHGYIPTDIGTKNPELRVFELKNNFISGTIPDSLSRLGRLKTFSLSGLISQRKTEEKKIKQASSHQHSRAGCKKVEGNAR